MLSTEWSKKDCLVFFLVAVLFYILPLILADYYYLDDSYRASAGHPLWRGEGRILIDLFYNALSLSPGIPNSFPLALLIACVAMAFALSSLVRHYFPRVNLAAALVVLPMWYSPFFLSNLSYQYDGPVMTLGVAAVIFAITLKSDRVWVDRLVSVVLVSAVLAIYQPLINLFAGLCCIELYRKLLAGARVSELLSFILGRSIVVLLAVALYFATAYPFITSSRQVMASMDFAWLGGLLARFEHLLERVKPFYTDSHRWLFIVLGTLAGIGYLWDGVSLLKSRRGWLETAMAMVCYLMIPFALLFCILGVLVFFAEEHSDSRMIVGSATLLMFVFFVIHRLLLRFNHRAPLFLILPVLFMVSLSYTYGRMLNDKKELELSIIYSLANSIGSHPKLLGVKKYYFIEITQNYWFPVALGTTSVLPIMPYLISTDFLLLPEKMIRAGITKVRPPGRVYVPLSALGDNPQPIVETLFYLIYVQGDDGYVVMKKMAPYHPTSEQ